MTLSLLAVVLAVFAVAGIAKGIIGLGLPTISMGLLAVVLPPAEAAVLLILPSLVTNFWQMVDGPHLRTVLRRLWPLSLGVCAGTWLGAAFLSGLGGPRADVALGFALMAYGLAGLVAYHPRVSVRSERWMGPAAGAVTGALTAATGVFVIPAVAYLQAIGLRKDELVQALGLSFTVSTLALAAALAGSSAVSVDLATLAVPAGLAVAASLAGMRAGQAVRGRLSPAMFRRCFFAGLLFLGAYLAARGLA